MHSPLDEKSLKTLFTEARSFSYWQQQPVSDELLKQMYDLMKMGPTAVNSCPARIVFIKTDDAKKRLKPCLAEGNIDKCMSAPVVAIIAWDSEFYTKLDRLFPHAVDARSWYEGKPDKIQGVGTMNSTLQTAYLIMAARSLGLDCGPMTGFDSSVLDAEFFADGIYRSSILVALGYGVREKLYPRGARLGFDEVCSII
ncbi:MAG: malonic semialdehyde reductase [Gammaproteobacteria bacterium]|nr:malonic semialdehyde reductase [Gammaproteobacteria bacterium]